MTISDSHQAKPMSFPRKTRHAPKKQRFLHPKGWSKKTHAHRVSALALDAHRFIGGEVQHIRVDANEATGGEELRLKPHGRTEIFRPEPSARGSEPPHRLPLDALIPLEVSSESARTEARRDLQHRKLEILRQDAMAAVTSSMILR